MNASEAQLRDFLEHKKGCYAIDLSLRPQGGITMIEKEAVNLCEVKIDSNVYSFGGISEDFYDEMVELYDTE